MGEALRTDMYQLTMMQAYWKSGHDDIEYLRTQGFDSEFLKHLRNFRFTGDILAMPEGSIAFPLEPIIRITAPIMEAQLIETFLLNKMNFSTLIATKALGRNVAMKLVYMQNTNSSISVLITL